LFKDAFYDRPDPKRTTFVASKPLAPVMQAVSSIYATNLALVLIGAVTGVLTARLLGASGKGEVAIAQAMVTTIAFILTLSNAG
jgi:O-antigen/teichoic acid export membrane protein